MAAPRILEPSPRWRSAIWREAQFLAAAPAIVEHVPTDADFRLMIGTRRVELRKIVAVLTNGSIDVDEFGRLFDGILLEGHTDGWVLGRQRAGDLREATKADRLVGLAAKDAESDYLNRFLEDLKDGRYTLEDGDLNAPAILNRANLYTGKMRGTANESYVEASPAEDEFVWHLVAEQHCEDCPQLAELSPYTKDTIISFPGDGNTNCLGNCKCFLSRTSDNRTAFKPVDP